MILGHAIEMGVSILVSDLAAVTQIGDALLIGRKHFRFSEMGPHKSVCDLYPVLLPAPAEHNFCRDIDVTEHGSERREKPKLKLAITDD